MEVLHNQTVEFFNMTDINDLRFALSLSSWVILVLALPLVCMAMYGLISLIKKDHVTPVFVLNLLISDIIQICTKPIVFGMKPFGVTFEVLLFAYAVGLVASTFFMVCIAGERYAMIAHPLWFRFHRTITRSVISSVIVWIVAVVLLGIVVSAAVRGHIMMDKLMICAMIISLLPYPCTIFFAIGTWWALSKSSVTTREQKRILGTIVSVMVIYTVFIVPHLGTMMVVNICAKSIPRPALKHLIMVSNTLLSFNSIADPLLYVFMRNTSWLPPPCCPCKKLGHQERQQMGEAEPLPPDTLPRPPLPDKFINLDSDNTNQH